MELRMPVGPVLLFYGTNSRSSSDEMRRCSSLESSAAGYDVEDELMTEKNKLRQTLRILKNDYSKAKSTAKRNFDQQQKAIHLLEKENYDLKLDLTNMASANNQHKDKKKVRVLQELQTDKLSAESDIQTTRKKLETVKQQADQLQQIIARKVGIPPKREELTLESLSERIETLEDNLFKKKQKVSCVISRNSKLRNDIEVNLEERRMLTAKYIQKSQLITDLKKDIKDTTLDAIHMRNMQFNYNAKYRSCQNTDERERDFYKVKVADLRIRVKEDDKAFKHMVSANVDREEPAYQLQKERYLHYAHHKLAAYHFQLEHYQDTWEKLQKLADSEDAAGMLKKFGKQEFEIFSKLGFTNALQWDIQFWEGEVKEFKEKIEREKRTQDVIRSTDASLASYYEDRISSAERLADRLEDKLVNVTRVLAEICNWMKTTYPILQISPAYLENPFHRDIGVKGLTYLRIMEYMKAIERRLKEFLSLYEFVTYKDLGDQEKFRLLKQAQTKRHRSFMNTAIEAQRQNATVFEFPTPVVPPLTPVETKEVVVPLDVEQYRQTLVNQHYVEMEGNLYRRRSTVWEQNTGGMTLEEFEVKMKPKNK